MSGEIVTDLVPMRARHLNSVLKIERKVYPKPWTRALFLSELTLRSSRAYYVALVQERVVGYGGILMAGEDAHVTNVAVDPDWQRARIATRLMLQLTAAALARGGESSTLEVRASNVAAQRLYAAFGYMPVGVRKGYYNTGGEPEDAIIMTASHITTGDYRERLVRLAAPLASSTTVADEIHW